MDKEHIMTNRPSLFDLTGKVALVTGAGSGMGRAICEAMAEHGANVVCADINPDSVNETSEIISTFGNRVLPVEADVFEVGDIKRMIETTVSKLKSIDIVFAHAAIVDTTGTMIHNLDMEDWDRIASRYIRGVFLTMKYVFPIMMEKQGGSFITTSAATGIWPLPPLGALHLATPYITAKSAVIMLSKIAARQYGAYGIRVNVICPGYHRSLHHSQDPKGMREMEEFVLNCTSLNRTGVAKDIKGLAVYLASEASGFVTGQIIIEDGGFNT
jgi:NAD(P)-dependent dehydrogenase (short-subunit alcohol dehydrogenase family)